MIADAVLQAVEKGRVVDAPDDAERESRRERAITVLAKALREQGIGGRQSAHTAWRVMRVAVLRDEGLSDNDIAEELGVDRRTMRLDRQLVETAAFGGQPEEQT